MFFLSTHAVLFSKVCGNSYIFEKGANLTICRKEQSDLASPLANIFDNFTCGRAIDKFESLMLETLELEIE